MRNGRSDQPAGCDGWCGSQAQAMWLIWEEVQIVDQNPGQIQRAMSKSCIKSPKVAIWNCTNHPEARFRKTFEDPRSRFEVTSYVAILWEEAQMLRDDVTSCLEDTSWRRHTLIWAPYNLGALLIPKSMISTEKVPKLRVSPVWSIIQLREWVQRICMLGNWCEKLKLMDPEVCVDINTKIDQDRIIESMSDRLQVAIPT